MEGGGSGCSLCISARVDWVPLRADDSPTVFLMSVPFLMVLAGACPAAFLTLTSLPLVLVDAQILQHALLVLRLPFVSPSLARPAIPLCRLSPQLCFVGSIVYSHCLANLWFLH